LRQLGDLTEKLVLVGGQALAFWVERYSDRLAITGPVNSKDIDFAERENAAAIAATRLGGTFKVPEPFAITPSSGLVEFRDPGGHSRRIDFLAEVFGLEASRPKNATLIGNPGASTPTSPARRRSIQRAHVRPSHRDGSQLRGAATRALRSTSTITTWIATCTSFCRGSILLTANRCAVSRGSRCKIGQTIFRCRHDGSARPGARLRVPVECIRICISSNSIGVVPPGPECGRCSL
jgi:hypothetical protein